MFASATIRIEARSLNGEARTACALHVARDLFGDWIVEAWWGRGRGRPLVRSARDPEGAQQIICQALLDRRLPKKNGAISRATVVHGDPAWLPRLPGSLGTPDLDADLREAYRTWVAGGGGWDPEMRAASLKRCDCRPEIRTVDHRWHEPGCSWRRMLERRSG
jgi:hypothetical protein